MENNSNEIQGATSPDFQGYLRLPDTGQKGGAVWYVSGQVWDKQFEEDLETAVILANNGNKVKLLPRDEAHEVPDFEIAVQGRWLLADAKRKKGAKSAKAYLHNAFNELQSNAQGIVLFLYPEDDKQEVANMLWGKIKAYPRVEYVWVIEGKGVNLYAREEIMKGKPFSLK